MLSKKKQLRLSSLIKIHLIWSNGPYLNWFVGFRHFFQSLYVFTQFSNPKINRALCDAKLLVHIFYFFHDCSQSGCNDALNDNDTNDANDEEYYSEDQGNGSIRFPFLNVAAAGYILNAANKNRTYCAGNVYLFFDRVYVLMVIRSLYCKSYGQEV